MARLRNVVLSVGLLVGAIGASPAFAHDPHRSYDPRNLIAFSRIDMSSGVIDLWTARPDGTRQRLVREGIAIYPDYVTFPAWSPDRRRLLFDFTDADGNQQLATIRPDGTGFRQLTHLPGISEAGDYSPDGRHIIFNRSPLLPDHPEFRTTLWVMRSDGSKPRPLDPDATTFDVEPEYSPDGTRLTFARLNVAADPYTAAIFVARSDGSHERQLTTYLHVAEHPRWSPNGHHILINIGAHENFEDPINGIYEVRARDGRMRQLLSSHESRWHGFKPDYSPDGKRILFGCIDLRAPTGDELCLMDRQGRHIRRLTNTPGVHENHPVWS